MTNIHYFPRYSQKENFCTNNTLLLLRQLYNFNRLRFERFLSKLLREAVTEASEPFKSLGLQIVQQIGTGSGVVDGYLYQESVRIAIETKRSGNSFYTEQLHRHLSGFRQSTGGFLILLSPDRASMDGTEWSNLAAEATAKNVILAPVTFESVIAAARGCLNDYDEEMHALVNDYEAFCSDDGLLPIDKWTVFAPPCGQSHEINTEFRLYFCPASWQRRKARYFGMYYEKAVRYIGIIDKVVECEVCEGIVVNETAALTEGERNRISAATKAAMDQRGWDINTGHQFFLFDHMCPTTFRKMTPGGIMGHRYFDLRDYFPSNMPAQLKDIADQMQSHQWE